jgi:hypothetical protein
MSRQISVSVVAMISIALFIFSFCSVLLGYFGLAAMAFVAAAFPAAVADILGQIGARPTQLVSHINRSRPVVFAALTALCGIRLSVLSGDVLLAGAGLWLGSLILTSEQLRKSKSGQTDWSSGVHSIALLMLPFLFTSQPIFGFGIAIFYVLATQFWRQRNIHRP